MPPRATGSGALPWAGNQSGASPDLAAVTGPITSWGWTGELRARHQAPEGAQLAVVSDLPAGAGLSSSAALALAAAAALTALTGRRLDGDAAADAAYRAEHDYVGVRCGRMDQTVVAHATAGRALLIETDTGARREVPLGFRTWILSTGVDHSLADGGYNARRAECERALEVCRRRFPSLPTLAGLEPEALSDVMTELPPPLDRRVRHVVSETARTRRAAAGARPRRPRRSRPALGRGPRVAAG